MTVLQLRPTNLKRVKIRMAHTITVEVNKADILPESIVAVEAAGVSLALCRLGENYCAFQNSCTHEEWPLSESYLVEGLVVCSLHGAQYDPQTGACLRGPACEPLRTYPVREQGDLLLVEVEMEITE